ncbi:MAG: NADH-quinone oxidoreductase subunit K [Pseudobdellovibrionaceae bacterium]
MEIACIGLIVVLFWAGGYLLLQKKGFEFVLGLALLSQGANLVLFVSSGLSRGDSPIMTSGESILSPSAANPLTQALILTAIVIGFATLVFSLSLILRFSQAQDSQDLDEVRE